MLLNKLLVVFAATAAALIPIEGGEPCGTELTDEDRQMSALLGALTPVTSQESIVIDTYMHIIAESNSTEGGYVPKEEVEAQFKILVKDYEKTGFTFALKDITWTVNKEWSNVRGYSYTPQVKALRKGSYKTLNLFYVKFIEGVGGFCSYPRRNPSQNDILHNVCFNRLATLPNGRPGSMGKTTTHEVGHWMNMIHPHEGGCANPNDYVDDTPAEKLGEFKLHPCDNKDKDTCPNMPGKDPIHNNMAYVIDKCCEEFTPGQIERMKKSWDAFRKNS